MARLVALLAAGLVLALAYTPVSEAVYGVDVSQGEFGSKSVCVGEFLWIHRDTHLAWACVCFEQWASAKPSARLMQQEWW